MQANLLIANDEDNSLATEALQFFCVWHDEGVTVLEELARRLQSKTEQLAAA